MVELTKSEREFLEVAMAFLKAPPEIDVVQISEALDIKPKSVTNKWWEIKKKLWPNRTQAQAKRKRPAADDDPDADEKPKPRPPKATKLPRAKKAPNKPQASSASPSPTVTKTEPRSPAAPTVNRTEPQFPVVAPPPVPKTEPEEEPKFEPIRPVVRNAALLPIEVTYGQPVQTANYQRPVPYGQHFNGLPRNSYHHPAQHNGLPANYQ